MNTNKMMKRKSPSKSSVFELSDNDVSPEHSDSDCDQPKSKLIKTEKGFVDSVVLAFTELENENNLESKLNNQSNETVTKSIGSDAVLPTTSEISRNDEELEEGEVDETSGSPRPPSPSTNNSDLENCLNITFSNENMLNLYKARFRKFIETFIELKVISEDKLSLIVKRDPLLSPTKWIVVDEVMDTNIAENEVVEEKLCSPLPLTPLKSKKRKRAKKEKNLFVVDTQPQSGTNNSCAKYSSKFNIEINENVEEDTVKVSVQTCFNCDENHSLKDCPEQKNYVKINLRRQKFKAQKLTSRYHSEDEQKFSHLVPGKISDGLREALGLRKNQLPPYIYQMRLLGYPPGWLEEAKFIHSNLKMFDSEGKHVKEGSSERNQGLNSEKIVDYPGFNVPVPNIFKDEFRQHQVPPYSEKYSKTVMLEYFAQQLVNKNEFGMDVDVETSVEDVADLNCKPSLPRAVLDVKKTEVGAPSPSLTDLEKAKQNLLAELNDNSSSNPKSEENTSEIPDLKLSENYEEINIPESKNEEPSEETSTNDTPQIENESVEISSSCQLSPPVNNSFNSVKDSSFGTPILKSNSSFSRLPKAENFMKDVSPVINFENLPNSTGKYEQMTDVLQKVRNTMKHLQNCKS